MTKSNTKYFLLAIAGSVIIGIGVFMLVNNYFEKTEVVVAAVEIPKGKIIEENDLKIALYYKNSLPAGYFSGKEFAVGRRVLVERKTDDPITSLVFEENLNKSLSQELKEGEVLIGLSIDKDEPIVKEISKGSKISIISTVKDDDYKLMTAFYNTQVNAYTSNLDNAESKGNVGNVDAVSDVDNVGNKDDEGASKINSNVNDQSLASNQSMPNNQSLVNNQPLNYQFMFNYDLFLITDNIYIANGQFIVKNLEVIEVYKVRNSNSLSVSQGKDEITNIFLRCSFKESPIIAKIVKNNEYKIFLEKSL